MVDPVEHKIFRQVKKSRTHATRVVPGRVEEIDGDRVRVRITDELEPVVARMDGATAIGHEVQVPLGTDGRPLGAVIPGTVPPDATPEYVGPTGRRILGEKIRLDETIQELTDARDRLDDMDEAIATASRRYLITDPGSPLDVTEPEDGWPNGAIWQQVDGNNIVIGRWVRDGDAWTPMKDGGAVLHAETVAAVVGVFIDGMMENLTVTGAANITEAALGELTARIANILTLNAEQIVVGADFRFWSGGLVLYAPAEQGQDPDDWPNRTPVFTITPGDVSLSVSQDGVITAGITPTGEVWGTYGAFDQLAVAGQTLDERLAVFPRGRVGSAAATTDIYVSHSGYFSLGVEFYPEAGREYEWSFSGNIERSAQSMRLYLYLFNANASQQKNFQGWSMWQNQAVHLRKRFTLEDFASLGVVEGDMARVYLFHDMNLTDATGVIRATPWVAVDDMGPVVVPKSYTPPAPEAPKPTPPPAQVTRTVTITSSPGVPIRPDGSFAPDGRRKIGGQTQGWGSDMAEYVYYPVNLSQIAGSTILSARVNFTVTQTKYSGTPIALRWDVTTGYLNGRVNFYNGAHGVGAGSGTASSGTRQSFVGKQGLLVGPLYPGHASQSYGEMGERITVTIQFRK